MKPEIIIMLTHHDVTVKDAGEIFEQCKDLPVKFWGFKNVGLPKDEMKKVAGAMKAAGKTTFLEVVTYDEASCLDGAQTAIDCGFDYLGVVLYFLALLSSHIVAFHIQKNLQMAALRHLAHMPIGYFNANPSGKLRKIIDENSFQTETFIAHQLPDLTGAQVTLIAGVCFMIIFDWRIGVPLIILYGMAFYLQSSLMGKNSAEFMRIYQDAQETMNHEAVEYIRGIAVVKVFGQTVTSWLKKAGCMRIWLHSSRNSKCLPYRHERPKREI